MDQIRVAVVLFIVVPCVWNVGVDGYCNTGSQTTVDPLFLDSFVSIMLDRFGTLMSVTAYLSVGRGSKGNRRANYKDKRAIFFSATPSW